MAKAVKLADIAERLNVSTVTVSKALSGQKGVSEAMREKIRQLADELGYKQPSATRRVSAGDGKRPDKSYNIGVLIVERYLTKYDSFYWQMYQQVAIKAAPKQCFTLMEVISAEAEKNQELPKLVEERKVDGIIIIGRLAERYLKFFERSVDIPVVYLDFCNEKMETDAVISDSYYGAFRLTNYLFEMGHEKIGFVGTVLSTGSITDRYLGYTKSLMEHGVKVREDWVIDDRDKETGLMHPVEHFALPAEMPTAFFCNCDLTASLMVKRLREAGYRVPQDISVVGYDNYLFPGMCDIGITTYEVDVKEMARRAIHMILKKVEGENYRQGISIVEGHIVVKDSVCDIRGNK